MSPEMNGNNPPTIAERKKKKRDKKHSSTSGIDECNVPPCNGYGNINSYPNLNQEGSFYHHQSFFNYPTSTEPMSLPIYPSNFPTYSFPSNPNLSYPGSFLNKPNFPQAFPSYSFDSNDYLSLPLVNMNQNETDKRRFSDPGPNDSDSSSTSIDNRVIQKLTQQINVLKEANKNLSRELNDVKIEINLLKQQQNNKHYERDYEPGMIAEFIRDLREAARVREDALIARVKHMIEEKQLSMNQFQVATEKSRNNDRLSKLEEQIKNLSLSQSNRSEDGISLPSSSTIEDTTSSAHQVIELEREALQLRRELQDARAKKEESEQKLQQLDKKLSHLLRRKEIGSYETISDDCKTSTCDTFSTTGSASIGPQRVTLSGPVTDL
ncbi:uncharacterized protein [Onthophagus taurus]|uniref:uncharacterized protein isoform X1 n=1 Tax=Onthophagus taurus TaxID=166361 RepID=UPI0039BE7DBF